MHCGAGAALGWSFKGQSAAEIASLISNQSLAAVSCLNMIRFYTVVLNLPAKTSCFSRCKQKASALRAARKLLFPPEGQACCLVNISGREGRLLMGKGCWQLPVFQQLCLILMQLWLCSNDPPLHLLAFTMGRKNELLFCEIYTITSV